MGAVVADWVDVALGSVDVACAAGSAGVAAALVVAGSEAQTQLLHSRLRHPPTAVEREAEASPATSTRTTPGLINRWPTAVLSVEVPGSATASALVLEMVALCLTDLPDTQVVGLVPRMAHLLSRVSRLWFAMCVDFLSLS